MEAPRRPPNRLLPAAPDPGRTAPAWDVRAAPGVSAAFGPLEPLESPRVQELVSKLERVASLADAPGAAPHRLCWVTAA